VPPFNRCTTSATFSCEQEIARLKGGLITEQPISQGQVFYQRHWVMQRYWLTPDPPPIIDLWYRYDGVADGRVMITRHFSESSPPETQFNLPLNSVPETQMKTETCLLGVYTLRCQKGNSAMDYAMSSLYEGIACTKPPDLLIIRLEPDLKITVRQITEKKK